MLRRHGVAVHPPAHLVPASTQFAEAVRLGFGWGMVPDPAEPDWTVADAVVLAPDDTVDVALFWQQWSLRTPSLEQVAAAIRAASAQTLRRAGGVMRSTAFGGRRATRAGARGEGLRGAERRMTQILRPIG